MQESLHQSYSNKIPHTIKIAMNLQNCFQRIRYLSCSNKAVPVSWKGYSRALNKMAQPPENPGPVVTPELVTFEQCTATARNVYKAVGMIPYLNYPGEKIPLKWQIVLFFCFIIIILAVTTEFLYFVGVLGDFDQFLELTAVLPCIGFTSNSIMKFITNIKNRGKISPMIWKLRDLFPISKEEQEFYRVPEYYKKSNTLFVAFAIGMFVWIFTFDFFAVAKSIVEYYFINDEGEGFTRRVPYYMWFPYDWNQYYYYEFTLLYSVAAGHCATVPITASDLLLCTLLVQICMQFDGLKRKLTEYSPNGDEHNKEDLKFVAECVKRQNEIYDISDQLAEMFGLSILINFSASVLVICMGGFQLSFGEVIEDVVTYSLFLPTATGQIFLLCSFGNMLSESSSEIADGAYRGEWYNGSNAYKKGILRIIQRSQKPQVLTALKFYDVSLQMFTKIMGKAFSVFALIKTVYGD